MYGTMVVGEGLYLGKIRSSRAECRKWNCKAHNTRKGKELKQQKMRCNLHTAASTPIFLRSTTKLPVQLFSSSTIKTKLKYRSPIALSSTCSQGQQQTQQPETSVYSVNFRTLRGCKLGISRYPDFVYDAEGGLGSGAGTKGDDARKISVTFDLQTLYIPPLNNSTTKFLGLPLPPLLKIDIVPELFQGTIDKDSGKVCIASTTVPSC